MTARTLFFMVTFLLVSALTARAQSQAGDELRGVAYPVADLIVPISSGPQHGEPATSENELMARIRANLAPQTWKSAGGAGSMRYEPKGYVLHVRQTAGVHAELKKFLQQLQRQQVSMETRLVFVSEKAFEEIEKRQIQWTKKEGAVCALLDDVRVLQFLRFVSEDGSTQILQMPKITSFDGQEAQISSGSTIQVVGIDFQAKAGVPVTPKIDEVFLGTRARFLNTISTDARCVNIEAEINYSSQPSTKDIEDLKVAFIAKVPDQRTLAVVAGTVLSDSKIEIDSPLARVPYLGRLVRNVGLVRQPMKVIVLLTPRIIREGETFDVQPLRTKIKQGDDGKFPLLSSQ